MEVDMNRRDFWKTMVAAVSVGGVEASNLLPAMAEQNGPATADVTKIYQLQAAFHRAKTAQDIALMMSFWDSKGTLRVHGDQKSPYVGTEQLRAYWLNSGSFKNRRFSLVQTIEETEGCDSLLVALDQRGMADPERVRRDGIAARRRHELRRLRRLHFSVTRCVSAAPHPTELKVARAPS
jgi:hypothetical protein